MNDNKKHETIQVITLKQPWIDFILYLDKDIECSEWNIPKRYLNDTLYLHADKTYDDKWLYKLLNNRIYPDNIKEIANNASKRTGMILGKCNMKCIPSYNTYDKWQLLNTTYLWIFSNVEELKEPIKYNKSKVKVWEHRL